MKYIFKKAQKELTQNEMANWIFFAYGVMESGIEKMVENKIFTIQVQIEIIEKTLLKGINQEIEARKTREVNA